MKAAIENVTTAKRTYSWASKQVIRTIQLSVHIDPNTPQPPLALLSQVSFFPFLQGRYLRYPLSLDTIWYFYSRIGLYSPGSQAYFEIGSSSTLKHSGSYSMGFAVSICNLVFQSRVCTNLGLQALFYILRNRDVTVPDLGLSSNSSSLPLTLSISTASVRGMTALGAESVFSSQQKSLPFLIRAQRYAQNIFRLSKIQPAMVGDFDFWMSETFRFYMAPIMTDLYDILLFGFSDFRTKDFSVIHSFVKEALYQLQDNCLIIIILQYIDYQSRSNIIRKEGVENTDVIYEQTGQTTITAKAQISCRGLFVADQIQTVFAIPFRVFENNVKQMRYFLLKIGSNQITIQNMLLLKKQGSGTQEQQNTIDNRRLIFDSEYKTAYQRDLVGKGKNYFYFRAISGIKRRYSRKDCDVTSANKHESSLERQRHNQFLALTQQKRRATITFAPTINTSLFKSEPQQPVQQRLQDSRIENRVVDKTQPISPTGRQHLTMRKSTLELSPARQKAVAHYNVVKLNRKMFKINRVLEDQASSESIQTPREGAGGGFAVPHKGMRAMSRTDYNRHTPAERHMDLEILLRDEGNTIIKDGMSTISSGNMSNSIKPRLEEVMIRHKQLQQKYRMTKTLFAKRDTKDRPWF